MQEGRKERGSRPAAADRDSRDRTRPGLAGGATRLEGSILSDPWKGQERAIDLACAGRLPEAVRILRRTLQEHPRFSPAISALFEICIPQGWFALLAAALEDARAAGNQEAILLEYLVLLHLEAGHPAKARDSLEELLAKRPKKRRIGPLAVTDVWRELAYQLNAGKPGRGLGLAWRMPGSSAAVSPPGRRRAAPPARDPEAARGAARPGRAAGGRRTAAPRTSPAISSGAPRGAPGTRVQGGRESGPARRRPPSSPPTGAATSPPAAAVPASTAPPRPLIPRVALGPIGIEVMVEESRLPERLERGATDGAARLRLALEAHRLSMVGNLDELLCLPHLHGVQQFWYQVETVRKVLRRFRGRALLCDEVGLGKTIEAGMAIKEYLLRGLVRSVLILVPPSLVRQWKEEMESKFGLAFATTSDPEHKADPDAFWRAQRLIVASLALARTSRHRERVAGARFDLVVVDEAHQMRNRSTEAWKLLDRVKSPFLLLLTATPLQNNLEELHNLITLLKPGQLATRAAFLREFVSKEDPTKPINEEKLRRLLSEVMVRNTRALAGLRLPPRHARTLVLDPTPAEKDLYEELSGLVRAHYRGASATSESGDSPSDGAKMQRHGLSRLTLRLLQSEAGSSPSALAHTLQRLQEDLPEPDRLRADLERLRRAAALLTSHTKVETLVSELQGQREQTLVFVTFRETLAFLEAGLRRSGFEPLVFHGGMSAEEKDAAIDRFRDGAPVLLTTEVGGEGRNLQFCRRLVNFDLPWNPMRIEQRIGRLHRIGQEREVEILNLCARGSVEDHLLGVLDRKINLFELVVGEVDLILGRLEDKREFPERVMEAWAQASTSEEAAENFERLAEDLGRAQADYERIRTLDQTLFGEDYEA